MIRIIIVDDHPIVRRGLGQIIAAEKDMQLVGEAVNGQEAFRIIRQTPCDLLVLDITLPDASGFEVLEQLKHECPVLPVLIMSFHEEEAFARHALKAGASGYLMKDSLPEELIKAIRNISSGRRYISQSFAESLASELALSEAPLHEELSQREFQVMCQIAIGKTLKEIGGNLCISEKTISTYRARILEKMHMKTNADVVGYALKHKLIE